MLGRSPISGGLCGGDTALVCVSLDVAVTELTRRVANYVISGNFSPSATVVVCTERHLAARPRPLATAVLTAVSSSGQFNGVKHSGRHNVPTRPAAVTGQVSDQQRSRADVWLLL